MVNVVGVVVAVAGLAAAVWGVTGSSRWSASVAGVVLFAAAALLLVDVGGDG